MGVDTAMAGGLLMPKLTMVATDTEATVMARGPLMLTTVATDMADTAMERGLLMLMLTTAMVDTEATATARGPLMPTMVVMDMADTATASNCNVTFILNINWPKKTESKIKLESNL